MPEQRPSTSEAEVTDLTSVAMQIIIHAGDARTLVFEAMDAATDGDFARAEELLTESQKKVQDAHRIHTDQIQTEAAGVALPYSLLFAHAQDTLMTVNSEFRIVRKTLALLQGLEARITRLEEAHE